MSAFEIPKVGEVIKTASDTFEKIFNSRPIIHSCAPGRVNLIGEHTDYNDGFVLPMALPLVTVLVGKRSNGNECCIITTCPHADEPHQINFKIPNINEKNDTLMPGKPMWANYVKGVMANYKGQLVGFNAVIATTVPVGGGLSSSAALEVATYSFLDEIANGAAAQCSLVEKATACQMAEHQYVGMPCGIMDQFISFNGKKDHALLLDCRSLDFQLIKLQDPSITVLITNTNVRHKLADSQYSNRKIQCEAAVKMIGKSSLRDATLEDLEKFRDVMDEEIHRRALHVVGEIRRTVEAANALKTGNYAEFGKLMIQSHDSLRINYEVSCLELDIVVNAALEVSGVFGSRMTGGGFGGCTVTLLKTEAVKTAMNHIKGKYGNATFYVCRPGDGAQIVKV